jgi:cytochrome c oxidase assembly protein subunit 11
MTMGTHIGRDQEANSTASGVGVPNAGSGPDAERALPPPSRNGRVAFLAAGIAVAMLGAAYAAVPIYKLICQATGLGGTTQRAGSAPGAVGDVKIRVRFDATVSSGLPWEFKPVEKFVDVRPGEAVVVNYEALNRSVRATTGTATFNVTPEIAGKYFSKIECFCFTQQELAGGQKVELPVTFFVDPALLTDKDSSGVTEITLSYTFFASPVANGGIAQKSEPGAAPGGGGVRAIQ